MTLRQKKYAAFAVILGAPILLLLMAASLEGAGADTYDVVIAGLVLAEIAGVCLHLYWMRCPHCGEHLDRNDGQYCRYCGKMIDWDAKPGRKGDGS